MFHYSFLINEIKQKKVIFAHLWTHYNIFITLSLNEICFYSMENRNKSSSKIRIFCLMVLALVAIIAVSVALAVVVIKNEETDDDSVTLPSTTADPNLISSKRGT